MIPNADLIRYIINYLNDPEGDHFGEHSGSVSCEIGEIWRSCYQSDNGIVVVGGIIARLYESNNVDRFNDSSKKQIFESRFIISDNGNIEEYARRAV